VPFGAKTAPPTLKYLSKFKYFYICTLEIFFSFYFFNNFQVGILVRLAGLQGEFERPVVLKDTHSSPPS